MQKGQFGIPLQLYGIVAFVLVILNQSMILILLSLFVVLAEKDDQTSRTVLEAMSIQFIANFFLIVIWLVTTFGAIIPFIGVAVVSASYLLTVAIRILSSSVAILGIIKAAKDEELNFPVLSNMADGLLSFINRF